MSNHPPRCNKCKNDDPRDIAVSSINYTSTGTVEIHMRCDCGHNWTREVSDPPPPYFSRLRNYREAMSKATRSAARVGIVHR